MKLMVTFKGKLLKALEFLPGIYVRKPKSEIWLMEPRSTNAIWYDSKLGRWIFGSYEDLLDDFGNPKIWIYSEDDVAGPQVATNWKYRRGRPIGSDDILVNSLVDSGILIHSYIMRFKFTGFPEIIALKSNITCYNLNIS